MLRIAAQKIRNIGVGLASQRPFRPISSPEKRVVLIRPDHLGDLLMLQPALDMLDRHAVEHEITLMCGPWNRDVAKHLAPELDVITWEFPGFLRTDSPQNPLDPYREIARAAETLRRLHPQAVVLFRDDHWWGALMANEAGIPLRIGYDNPQLRPFLTHPVAVPHTHYAQQNLILVQSMLAVLGYSAPAHHELLREIELRWPENEQAADRVEQLIFENQLRSGFVVIHPGTGAPVKQWPELRWAHVADSLEKKFALRVVLTGSSEESALCEEIAGHAATNPDNFAGMTTLFELAELFRRSRLVLGVDSGPLHLATAVETPSIHLYGPSDQIRYGPWGDELRHRIVRSGICCPSCGDLSPTRMSGCACMTAITARTVIEHASEVLGDGA